MEQTYNPYYCLRVLSYNPLITMSGCQTDDIFIKQMADDLPEVFGQSFGLHFLLPTWNVEGYRSREIKNSIEAASKKMPGHVFVVVSSTEFETLLLSVEGVPTLFAHQAIFVDERNWEPSTQKHGKLGSFDAVINARFDKVKRHELAAGIKSLLLTYAYSLDADVDESTKRIRIILPQAYFANHELNGGSYSYLSKPDIVKLFGHAHVGLCLSPQEGYSRASIEYLMSGLPVVSTQSIGGRDRYYSGKYCRVVSDNEREIARAVRELVDLNYSRESVRAHVLGLIGFDRENFLRSFNRTVEHFTGLQNAFGSIEPFLGVKQDFITHSKILQKLKLDQTVSGLKIHGKN
jgi:glycosyltransferase involved in cell wall biosynthesis